MPVDNKIVESQYAIDPVACTRLVASVINDLRAYEHVQGVVADFPIERALQVEALCQYQQHLINTI